MRSIGTRIGVVVGTVFLIFGLVAGHISRNVLDEDRLATHLDQARRSDEVSASIAKLITARLLESNPDLVAIRPLLEAASAELVRSDRFDASTRMAAIEVIRSLTEDDPDEISIAFPDAASLVFAGLQRAFPDLVEPQEPGTVSLISVGESTTAERISTVSQRIRLFTWLFPLLAVLCFAGSIVIADDRRLAITQIGRSMLVGACILATAIVLAGFYVRSVEADTVSRATAKQLWSATMPPIWWSVALLAGGAVAVVKLSGATLTPKFPTVMAASRWLSSRNTAALVGVGVAVVALGFLVFGRSADSPKASASLGEICNGHAELCTRSFDDVAYAATHNAMSVASEPGWFIPEQSDSIPTQLDQGVRALLVDVWPARMSGEQVVTAAERADLARKVVQQDFGPAALTALATLSNLRAGSPTGPTSLFLCHGLCEIGSEPLPRMLDGLHAWLVENPNEVVTLFIEDYVATEQIAQDVINAGLGSIVATPPMPGDPWPTLGEMIRSGRRLVVMVENGTSPDDAPWLVNGFEYTQDTPYTFRSVDEFSCAPNRGPSDAGLFLLNHWLAGMTSLVTNAIEVNTSEVLGTRAEKCEDERGQIPNFVAVNYVAYGDTFAVVDRLNGVG